MKFLIYSNPLIIKQWSILKEDLTKTRIYELDPEQLLGIIELTQNSLRKKKLLGVNDINDHFINK